MTYIFNQDLTRNGIARSQSLMFVPKSKGIHIKKADFIVPKSKRKHERKHCHIKERNCVHGWAWEEKERKHLWQRRTKRRFSFITKVSDGPSPDSAQRVTWSLSLVPWLRPAQSRNTRPPHCYQNINRSCMRSKWVYLFHFNLYTFSFYCFLLKALVPFLFHIGFQLWTRGKKSLFSHFLEPFTNRSWTQNADFKSNLYR